MHRTTSTRISSQSFEAGRSSLSIRHPKAASYATMTSTPSTSMLETQTRLSRARRSSFYNGTTHPSPYKWIPIDPTQSKHSGRNAPYVHRDCNSSQEDGVAVRSHSDQTKYGYALPVSRSASMKARRSTCPVAGFITLRNSKINSLSQRIVQRQSTAVFACVSIGGTRYRTTWH